MAPLSSSWPSVLSLALQHRDNGKRIITFDEAARVLGEREPGIEVDLARAARPSSETAPTSGAHMTLVARIVTLLREQGVADVIVTVGGTIPNHDIPELERLGVAAVFTPGAVLQDIIDFLQRSVGERTPV